MAAEVKARITVDAANALKRIEEINKASGYTSASMSKMAKEVAAANSALATLGGGMGGTASGTAFKNITDQLEKQALAYSLVDSKSKAASQSAALYRNAIISLTKSGSLTKEQTDELVRSYNSYKTAAESAKKVTDDYAVSVHNAAPAVDKFAVATKDLDDSSNSYLKRLVTLTKNILVFQLIMGPIRSAVSGVKNTLRESLDVAAEAEQTYSKLATVFDGFEKSASRAATSLASALGVAKSTSSGALSTVGDLLQAQGMGTAESLTTASRWTSQFYDIINFKDINMTLEEFAQNFMSGAAGNLRNFRTFGSIVKESAVQAELARKGLDKLTGSQLELAKMTARAEMALEQQANAIGATEREWDTVLSVNRRLNEAWKEYKENLGETLNGILRPFKKTLTDILSDINRAKRAAKDVESGSLSSSVYDIRANAQDRATFRKDLMSEFNSYESDFNRYSKGVIGSDETLGFDALMYVMKMYGATLEDVTNILGNKFPEAARQYLASLEDERQAAIREQEAIERRTAALDTLSDTYDSFTEALLGIPGVSFIASDFSNAHTRFSGSDAGQAFIEGQIAATIMSNVEDALASVSTAELAETFGGVIAGALGDLDEAELRSSQIDAVRSLFEATWNQFAEGGFSDEEKKTLEEISATYKRLNDELEAYNNELKRQQEFLSSLNSMRGVTSGYDVQLAQLRMTDDQKLTDNLRRQYAEAYALAATPEEQQQINDAYEEAEQTLLAFLNAQRIYNEELAAEAAEKERLAQYEEAVKTISESTADYAAQMAQVGMTDNEKALDDLRLAYEKMRSELTLTEEEAEALDADYEKQRQALINLQARQKEYNDFLASEAARLAAAEAAVTAMRNGQSAQGIMANYAMTTINPLQATGKYASADTWRAGQRAGLRETEAQLLGLGVAASDVNAWIAEMIPLINEGYEAKKAEIDATEEETEALKKAQQWLAVESRVTGSMGTLGGVIQSFQGDGDIWSKIVNALLSILENTESWGEIAEVLDQIFAMFEPVTEALIDLIVSLPWEDIIFMLKVIASAITIISGVVQGVQTVIEWLWDNIKTALRNVATDVYNLFHPFNTRRRDQYRSFEELVGQLNKIADDTNTYLDRIWSANEKIERNTAKGDDYAKQLALLRSLYEGGVLTDVQYSGEVAKVTGSSLGSVERYSGTTYATGNGGITYFSGDIVINGYNGDPEELAKEIERVLNRRAMAGANTY